MLYIKDCTLSAWRKLILRTYINIGSLDQFFFYSVLLSLYHCLPALSLVSRIQTKNTMQLTTILVLAVAALTTAQDAPPAGLPSGLAGLGGFGGRQGGSPFGGGKGGARRGGGRGKGGQPGRFWYDRHFLRYQNPTNDTPSGFQCFLEPFKASGCKIPCTSPPFLSTAPSNIHRAQKPRRRPPRSSWRNRTPRKTPNPVLPPPWLRQRLPRLRPRQPQGPLALRPRRYGHQGLQRLLLRQRRHAGCGRDVRAQELCCQGR